MTKNEEFQYRIISDFLIGKLKRIDAAQLLTKSERTISRMARKQQKKGFLGVKHGNYGKKPVNKIPRTDKEKIMKIVEEKYFDHNMTHCLEKIQSDEGFLNITYSTFRRWCHEKKNC